METINNIVNRKACDNMTIYCFNYSEYLKKGQCYYD